MVQCADRFTGFLNIIRLKVRATQGTSTTQRLGRVDRGMRLLLSQPVLSLLSQVT